MPTDADPARRTRNDTFDGIRGVAIILVVLSHSWTLVPLDRIRQFAPLDGLFRAGDQAVTVFFVLGGFLVTRTLLRRAESPDGIRPLRYFLQRFVRIGVQLYPLLIVVVIVHYLDRSDIYSTRVTYRSVASIGTFTWNWYLENNPLTTRSDLGQLWYLSVQEQFFVGMVIVLALFARFRSRLILGAIAAIVLVTIWRIHVWDVEGWWRASLRTTTRCDGLLWGMLAALVVDRFAPLRRYAASAFTISTTVIAGLMLFSGRFTERAYYTWLGPLIDAALAVWVVAAVHLADLGTVGATARLVRVLTWRPLVATGVASLSIYIWHYPLFWFISRHTHGWGWFARALLGLTALTALVLALQRHVDEPSRRWLARFARRPKRLARSAPRAAPATGPLEQPADAVVRQP